MDYEKAYKYALGKAKEWCNLPDASDLDKKLLGHMFPELKESNNEEIRKWCIMHFRECLRVSKDNPEYQEYLINNVMPWLKKQGEQKPDKVEPKFKNGQWIVWQDKYYKVNYNGCGYELVDQNGLSTSLEYGTIDEHAHLWSIQDAKPGDMLAAHECYVIFKEIDGLNIKCYCTYHYMGSNPRFYTDTLQNKNAFYPATKEQRDTLMKAMVNTGYTFDFDKKELKKIEYKPTWNEEDEEKFRDVIRLIEQGAPVQSMRDHYTNWLKSLRPQKQWKPSEEQIIALRWVLNNVPYCKHKEEISGLLDQIKEL
jgi:hypothetical protein